MIAKSRNDILFRFLADTKSLQKGGRTAEGSLKGVDKKTTTLTRSMGGLQKAFIAAGGAMAIKEAAQFAFDAAQMAEQANIVAGSFDETFGPAAQALRSDLQAVRTQVGLNSLEFEKLLLNTGSLAVGFGLTREEAANLGDQMFIAAADLAAFRGDTALTDEALHALNRALVGEFDPLEQFVGGIKASTVATKALELGLADTTSELTDQDKAIALLALVADNGADAIGSLAEQEETLASKTLEANARLDDLKIQIGQGLLPVMTDAAEKTLDFADGVGFLSDESVPLTERMLELVKALDGIARNFTTANIALRIWESTGMRLRGVLADLVDDLVAVKDAATGLLRNPFRDWRLPSLPSLPNLNPFSRRHTGGVVPGPTGTEQPVMAKAGERIVTRNSQQGGGGGVTINITAGIGDPVAIAEQVQDLLELYGRTNGTF